MGLRKSTELAIAYARSQTPRIRTVSVVVQVRELVTPLCYNAQRVLEESDDDQKATNCRKVTVERPS